MGVKTMFIVDDNRHICKIIACQFRSEFNCKFFDNQAEALAAVDAGIIPDVIVSDAQVDAPESIPVIVYSKPFDPEDIVFEVNSKVK